MKIENFFSKLNIYDYFENQIGFTKDENFLYNAKTSYSELFDEDFDGIDEDSPEFKVFYEKSCDEELKKCAESWYSERLSDFFYDLQEIGSFAERGIICSRSITVDDKEEFLFHLLSSSTIKEYKGIGIYWAWEHNKAEAHWSQGQHELIVKALIPYSSIFFILSVDGEELPSELRMNA